ncbi:2OG-Fe(II) oxygenase [Pseudomonas indica]|uniref:2OG-Fe(II) oxygenase n=1 Tax=Pseudomonas indica TaxID=137658 RepID=UPI000BABB15A|nr:2OG-Fe(II) oxygenase [Pseudomonas indica]MBU3058157.1 2OG-Fe(II) oxygenase [Pseudomonas indica]PAU64275.1 iron-regulated protein [Pseudomonas indica]
MKRIDYGADIFTLADFLSPSECGQYIALSQRMGYEEAAIQTRSGAELIKEVRNNDRVIFDDPALAQHLFERARPLLPDDSPDWRLSGFNERFRFYRYVPGQFFTWHKDGFYRRNDDEISQYTFLIYLNDGYQGGETEFKWDIVKPEAGMALVFPHLMMHQGRTLDVGVKYVLRTDVMYERHRPTRHYLS